MRIALDTNVLLRLDDSGHVQHADALSAVEELAANGHEMILVPQVLYEYWVVATRPAEVNGLGLDAARADQLISEWLNVFTLLRDERKVFRFWRELVTRHDVKGKNAHDARIVAAMQRHCVSHLLTLNVADFTRFTVIQAWALVDILSGKHTLLGLPNGT